MPFSACLTIGRHLTRRPRAQRSGCASSASTRAANTGSSSSREASAASSQELMRSRSLTCTCSAMAALSRSCSRSVTNSRSSSRDWYAGLCSLVHTSCTCVFCLIPAKRMIHVYQTECFLPEANLCFVELNFVFTQVC